MSRLSRGRKKQVLKRDHWTCQMCGALASTVDHIIPTSKGGTHEFFNLQAACEPCNQQKGNKIPTNYNLLYS